jgi:hypothetical protein
MVDKNMRKDAQHKAQAVIKRLVTRAVALQIVKNPSQEKGLKHLRVELQGKASGVKKVKEEERLRRRHTCVPFLRPQSISVTLSLFFFFSLPREIEMIKSVCAVAYLPLTHTQREERREREERRLGRNLFVC